MADSSSDLIRTHTNQSKAVLQVLLPIDFDQKSADLLAKSSTIRPPLQDLARPFTDVPFHRVFQPETAFYLKTLKYKSFALRYI